VRATGRRAYLRAGLALSGHGPGRGHSGRWNPHRPRALRQRGNRLHRRPLRHGQRHGQHWWPSF